MGREARIRAHAKSSPLPGHRCMRWYSHEMSSRGPSAIYCVLEIVSGVGLLIAPLASAFQHLTVVDLGEALTIGFGSTPPFRWTVRSADIQWVEVGRTLLLDGWGICWSLGADGS